MQLIRQANETQYTVLALDLATATGWALSRPGCPLEYGTRTFKSQTQQIHKGRMWKEVIAFLKSKNEIGDPITHVFHEQPAKFENWHSTVILHGQVAIVQLWCALKGIPCQDVPIGTIKKHATDKGNASKSDMIAAVQASGYDPKDDNQADAIAIADLALTTLNHRRNANAPEKNKSGNSS